MNDDRKRVNEIIVLVLLKKLLTQNGAHMMLDTKQNDLSREPEFDFKCSPNDFINIINSFKEQGFKIQTISNETIISNPK